LIPRSSTTISVPALGPGWVVIVRARGLSGRKVRMVAAMSAS
jgi:hypothetical protein